MCEDAPKKDESSELLKLRFDYAWKWFAFHAEQRTKMFNFMLLAVGIMANAILISFKEKVFSAAIILCGVGFLTCLIFSRLDRRNKELVHLAENMLVYLERTDIFGDSSYFSKRGRRIIGVDETSEGEPARDRAPFGLLWHQDRYYDQPDNVYKKAWIYRAWGGQHRIWIPLTSYMFAFVFLLIFIILFYQKLRPLMPRLAACIS